MADSGCEDTVPSASPLCKMPEESDATMRARLFTSLSQSFPHSQLFKALHGETDLVLGGDNFDDDDDDSLYGDHLSNSCFATLRMERRDSDDFDDDLRSLEWLHSEDLLKNIGGEKLDKEDDGEEQKENEDIKPDINLLQASVGQQHTSLPYLPQKHINSKPPYSFSCLIFMAVENSPQKRLPVKDIYNWILTQFPYFQNAPTGWKNSVRHNLSLNKCFKKVDKDKGQSIGKGSLWCIDPAYRPNLLQALRKTPYHPYHQLQMTSTAPQNYAQFQSLPGAVSVLNLSRLGRSVLPLTQRPIPNTVSPHLFPFLSRRLAQTPLDVDSEMKDVAQTLVSLKSSHSKDSPEISPGCDTGPTWRNCKPSYCYNSKHRPSSPVTITDHPYNDHAYSSTRLLEDDLPSTSSSSSIDEEYDFGSDADEEGESDFQSEMEWDSDGKDEVDGELPSLKRSKPDIGDGKNLTSAHKSKGNISSRSELDEDEQKKIHEGANALLNLAGLIMNNRCTNGSKCNSDGNKASDSSKKKRKKKRKKLVEKIKPESPKVKKMRKTLKPKRVKQVEEEDKTERRRGVSKRKNAGSNGKYDNDDFTSTYKVSKTNDSSKKLTPLKSKEGSDKLLSASDRKKQENKKTVTNGKGVGKKNVRKKLPLSKSFGTSSKLNGNKNEQWEKIPKGKNINNNNHNSNNNNNIVDKKASKDALAIKRKKKNNTPSSNNNVASKDDDTQSPVSNSYTTNINNNELKLKTSGENVTKDKSKVEEVTSAKPKENGTTPPTDEALSDISFPSVATVVKKELSIDPSGDAPALMKSETQFKNMWPQDTSAVSENGHSESRSESVSPQAGTVVTSSAVVSHQSHHFTRFSKKKKGSS